MKINKNYSNVALLLIDVQKGFLDSFWGNRNNPDAEKNIKFLLNSFRKKGLEIIHIQHLSKCSQSPLRPGQLGVEFMDELTPKLGERIFQKSVNSAFIGTNLKGYLKSKKIEHLFMVGFTTDHCISTSARMASNLGFKVTVISDATVAYEKRSISGKIFEAELVHQISLASLAGEFAEVKMTEAI